MELDDHQDLKIHPIQEALPYTDTSPKKVLAIRVQQSSTNAGIC